jgi:hypothetical protein
MKLFDDKICHLTFSHTDCADVWKLFFPQMRENLHVGMEHFLAVNENHAGIPDYIKILQYEDGNTYPQRLLSCLEKLEKYEFIFFDHEDMFLYHIPDYIKLQKYYQYLTIGEFDFIRLIKGGDCQYEPVMDCPTLYRLSLKSKWIFSIQPSFWRRTVLMNILRESLNCNVWELEMNSQKIVKKIRIKAAFSYRSGQRRGAHHFDNNVYPYVATAIGKGKWNLGEYGAELEPLLDKYDINPTIRGWF